MLELGLDIVSRVLTCLGTFMLLVGRHEGQILPLQSTTLE